MDIKKVETLKNCRFCAGRGYDYKKGKVKKYTLNFEYTPCGNCKGTGEITDYHYIITNGKFSYIVDTLK